MSESLSGELRRADYGIFQDVFLSSGFIQMSGTWSNEELEAAVEAYVEMQRKERTDQIFTKRQYYRKLAELFGRSEKAYEYRMQIFRMCSPSWNALGCRALNPKKILTPRLRGRSKNYWAKSRDRKRSPLLLSRSRCEMKAVRQTFLGPAAIPIQNPGVQRLHNFDVTPRLRHGSCSKPVEFARAARKPAPFKGSDGLPYLELHYVQQLAEGGPDTVTNAVVLCPNCHREIHYGTNAHVLAAWVYDNVARLIRA